MTRRMTRQPKSAEQAAEPQSAAPQDAAAAAPAPTPAKKIDAVIALLARDEGATLAEMVEATGWLPHTARAALTGLKKKGHTLEKSKRGDTTCYSIAVAG